jgi:Domain of unknown function (DUF5753)
MPGSFALMQFTEAAIPDVVYVDTMAGELFLEEESDVRRYKLVFEHLRAVAESPDASRWHPWLGPSWSAIPRTLPARNWSSPARPGRPSSKA